MLNRINPSMHGDKRMKITIGIMALVCAWLYVSNEDYKDQVELAVTRSCLAQKVGELTVSERRRDGSVQCTTHENVGAGMVPRLKFAEIWTR